MLQATQTTRADGGPRPSGDRAARRPDGGPTRRRLARRVVFAVALLACLAGCERPNPAPAIENVLLRDAAISVPGLRGAERAAAVAERMQAIDASDTPEDFRAAWAEHLAAWRQAGAARSDEASREASANIKTSYEKLERVAQAHGAKLPEKPDEAAAPPPTYAQAVDCAAQAQAILLVMGHDESRPYVRPLQTVQAQATRTAMTLREQRSPDQVELEITESLSSTTSAGFDALITTLQRNCGLFFDPAETEAAARRMEPAGAEASTPAR